MSQHYHIVGFPDRVEVRAKIEDFMEKEPEVFNLYILALDQIQRMDEQARTSFFQIAGIHGMPYVPWDNVDEESTYGYCTHQSVLFPTWHRTYALLFEQAVQKEALAIAEKYTDPKTKELFREAALKLRLPYWDWAASPELPPKLFDEKISVFEPPLATKAEIDNPLQAYRFQKDITSYGFDHPYSVWPQTIRNPPDTEPKASDKSQKDKLQQRLRAQYRQLRARVYDLLIFTKTWEHMSNTADGRASSLEGVHDMVHNLIGGTGHMSNVPVAAFDPIFWYHHVNVDRLLALWLAVHPGSRVPATSRFGHGEKSELLPFHIDDGTFWTSDKTYNSRTVGNRYPEFPERDVSPEELKVIALEEIQRLYGPTLRAPRAGGETRLVSGISTAAFGVDGSEAPTNALRTHAPINALRAHAPINALRAHAPINALWAHAPTNALRAETSADAIQTETAIDSIQAETSIDAIQAEAPAYAAREEPLVLQAEATDDYRVWIAHVVINTDELPYSGYVHVFLSHNEPTGNPIDWLSDDDEVGTVAIFKNTRKECVNCNRRSAENVKINGQVFLTEDLLDRGKDLHDVGGITEYLKTHMHWRIALVDGAEVPLAEVPSLEVRVHSATVHVGGTTRGGSEPWRDELEVHHDVTHGRVGGYAVPA
ncbi:Di-copper centre-containing protein [Trametopsis cervina]|nr:Di-copper centre-containing protein [Trametopsis cervina]